MVWYDFERVGPRAILDESKFRHPIYNRTYINDDCEKNIDHVDASIEREKIHIIQKDLCEQSKNIKFIYDRRDETYYVIRYDFENPKNTFYCPIKAFFIEEEIIDRGYTRNYRIAQRSCFMLLGYHDENEDVGLTPISCVRIIEHNKKIYSFIDQYDNENRIYEFNYKEEIL